jgi:hypothetical protein
MIRRAPFWDEPRIVADRKRGRPRTLGYGNLEPVLGVTIDHDSARSGSEALLNAIKIYVAKHHPGVRL